MPYPIGLFAFLNRHQMTRLLLGLLVAGLGISAAAAAGGEAEIVLNTIGYPTTSEKLATCGGQAESFVVHDVNSGKVVLRGACRVAPRDATLRIADFSALQTPGVYRIETNHGATSPPFSIATGVYNHAFDTCTRAMYLWRCGAAVDATFAGHRFHYDACHLEDGLLLPNGDEPPKKRDGVGGWHDAGDHNKYVVNGAFTVGMMLQAWEHFEQRLSPLNLRIPESDNRVPDYLDEVRWELEWLLKMQADDGRVYHKLSTLNFGGMVLPDEEQTERYFCPWSSSATADFTAVMAQAARVYRKHDTAFAERCLQAAWKSHAFLQEHPENHSADQSRFTTGQYPTKDDDDRDWALAELWETTGDAELLAQFEQRIRAYGVQQGPSPTLIEHDWDWNRVRNFGLFTYLLSERAGRDPQLVARVAEDAVACADRIVGVAERHPYGRTLGERYYWGVNGSVARLCINLEVADRISPDKRRRRTKVHALSHLFGRNPDGRCYVTGLGHRPPLHPHDRRSAGDDAAPPWPGYLVGGPWPTPLDWQDVEEDYRTNEFAINWNGALIYALAAFVEPDTYDQSLHPVDAAR